VDPLLDSPALVEAARQCTALRHAQVLSDWVGSGRKVTAKQVLARTDVGLVGRALGIKVPQRVRSAADLPAVHYPWVAALEVGLLSVSEGRAGPGPAQESWRSAGGGEVLSGWSRGLVAALASTFDDEWDGAESVEIGRRVLTVLAADLGLADEGLSRAIARMVAEAGHRLYATFDRGFGMRDPATVALELLSAFGAVTDSEGRWRITPLGRRALSMFGDGVTPPRRPAVAIPDDAACQLKISLRFVRPACWRRVLVPASATLGELHSILQIAFAWDGDHLHGFTIGRRQYGDPYFDAEYDEDAITLTTAFTHARKPISYVYDFGDSWQHEITLEKTVALDPAASYPVCVDGRGDAPVEDCDEDEAAWIPFDQAGINRQFAQLGADVRPVEARLRDDIEVILTDAYGEAEEVTAFQTVLEDVIDFPVPAASLGEPIIVTGLIEDDDSLGLRVRCRGKTATGLVSFADLEFRPGTVEAWLHAAYLTYLGRRHPTPTAPTGWDGLTGWGS
jgi:hypothetical protein